MSNSTHDDICVGRHEAEIALLQAMYPSDMTWHEQRQEINYRPETGGSLTIRVPDEYPAEAQPVLIQAFDVSKDDIRDLIRDRVASLSLPHGEEVLDSIIQVFEEVVREREEASKVATLAHEDHRNGLKQVTYKTVIIWLHHLLNTNKRKLALNPSNGMDQINGVTKPGYPGILIYSGASDAVDAHVSELKNQRWQAFQIRLEEIVESKWTFSHSYGIKEVESMSEVAQSISHEQHRQEFLEATGIK